MTLGNHRIDGDSFEADIDCSPRRSDQAATEKDPREVEVTVSITHYELDLILEEHRQCILSSEAESTLWHQSSVSSIMQANHAEKRLLALSPEKHSALRRELVQLRAEWQKEPKAEDAPRFPKLQPGWHIAVPISEWEEVIETDESAMYQLPPEAQNHEGNIYELIEALGTTEPSALEV
jgi:hypothetical protein